MIIEFGRASEETKGSQYTLTKQDATKNQDLTIDPMKRYNAGLVAPFVKVENIG